MNNDPTIPWALSELKPSELVTLKDMTPEEAKRARQDAEYWASEGLATWKYDKCQCGERYAVLSPRCNNRREHQEVAARLEAEVEKEELVSA